MAWKKVYVKGKGYRYTDGNGNYRLTNPEAKKTLKKAATALYNVPQKAADTLNRLGIGVNKNRKPKPKPTNSKIDSSKYDMDSQSPKGPNQVKPAKSAEAKPKPKPQPTPVKPKPKPQPTAAKPKPKPQPARSSTYSQAAMMKDIRAGEAAAARSKELKKLQELREEAKKKSLEQAKKNRARGQRRGGPRD